MSNNVRVDEVKTFTKKEQNALDREKKLKEKRKERIEYFKEKGFPYESLVDIIYRCYKLIIGLSVFLLFAIIFDIIYAILCH